METSTFCFFFFFLMIHMSNIWIYVISYACMVGWLVLSVCLAWQKLKHWILLTKFSTNFFHTCNACMHFWLLPFYTTLSDLDLGWEQQGKHKAKPVCSIFLHTVQVNGMKSGMMMKQFKPNILRLVLSDIYCIKGNNNNNNHTQRCYSRFLTISSQRRELSPKRMLKWPRRNYVQITCNTLSAYHVQHVVLRATWYEETAQLLSLTELKLHSFKLYFVGWIIKPMKEGRKPEYQEKTAVLLTAPKNFNVGMHSDIYEPAWFKHDLMRDTSDLYILILVHINLTLIPGHRDAREQNLLCQLSPEVFNGFGWDWHAVETCWSDKSCNFSCLVNIQGKESSFGDFIKKNTHTHTHPLTLACIPTSTHWFLSNLVW